MSYVCVDWIHLADNTERWQALENTAINFTQQASRVNL
jgi:hypothetical protein